MAMPWSKNCPCIIEYPIPEKSNEYVIVLGNTKENKSIQNRRAVIEKYRHKKRKSSIKERH